MDDAGPNWGQSAITGKRSKATNSVDRALTPIWLRGVHFLGVEPTRTSGISPEIADTHATLCAIRLYLLMSFEA